MQVLAHKLKLNNNVTLKRKKIGFRSELIDFVIRKSALQGVILYDDLLFKNRLVRNFYEELRGLLNNINVSMVDISGSSFTARTSGNFSRGISTIFVGDDTEELPFDAYVLTSHVSNDCSLVEIVALSSSIEIRHSALAAKTGSSVGLNQRGYDTSGGNKNILLAGKLLSVNVDESIIYKLIFNEPWVYNMANWFYGINNNVDAPNEKDLAGNIYTLRSSGDAQASVCKIVTGDGTDAWSPTDYSLTNPVEHETTFASWVTDYAIEYVWRTWYIPPSDETIEEIGLVQKLYDDGGAQYDTLLARIALGASPLNLVGGNYYIIRLRIVGS